MNFILDNQGNYSLPWKLGSFLQLEKVVEIDPLALA